MQDSLYVQNEENQTLKLEINELQKQLVSAKQGMKIVLKWIKSKLTYFIAISNVDYTC